MNKRIIVPEAHVRSDAAELIAIGAVNCTAFHESHVCVRCGNQLGKHFYGGAACPNSEPEPSVEDVQAYDDFLRRLTGLTFKARS